MSTETQEALAWLEDGVTPEVVALSLWSSCIAEAELSQEELREAFAGAGARL